MRLRLRAFVTAAAITAGACSDNPVEPDLGPLTDVTLDLCGSFDFNWMAYQNRGQAWQQLTPALDGTVTFKATETVSIAIVWDFFGSSITEVLNATAAELAQFGTSRECEVFGDRAIAGSVNGLTGEQSVDVYGALSSTTAAQTFPDWVLEELPNEGSIDVIATRAASPSFSPPDRVIVRRGITPSATGVPIAPLDFDAEGVPLESNVATVVNGDGDPIILESAVLTANGTLAILGQLGGTSATQIAYPALPAALRSATDMHSVWLSASGADGDREIFHYFRTPANLTLTLGPQVPEPTLTQVATTPYLRARAELTSQAEYPDAASAEFFQSSGGFAFKLVAVTTTAGHLGARPATWRLEIPDFGNSGYDPTWGLSNGSFDWGVAVIDGDIGVALGAEPADGTTLRLGTRLSQMQISVQRIARPPLRHWMTVMATESFTARNSPRR